MLTASGGNWESYHMCRLLIASHVPLPNSSSFPNFSPARTFFRLTPVTEKGLSSTGQILPSMGRSRSMKGGRITVGENSLVVISPRTRFGLQQCIFLGRVEDACLQRLRWEGKMEKSTLSRYRTLFSILYFDSVVFRFFFCQRKKSSTEIYYY